MSTRLGGARDVSPRIAVIIPAFNEERFIGSVVLRARKYADLVIVVDDGSTDATSQIARDAGAMVLSHPVNLGKSAALNTAFILARKFNPAVLVTLDGDGQHLPHELLQVAAPILAGQADLVIGSRYLQAGCQTPRHRVWGHVGLNFITALLAGVYTTDSQSGYRAFSPKALSSMRFQSTGFSVESEMQFLARAGNLSLVEVPITVCYFDKPKRSAFTHGILVLNGLVDLSARHRPTLFFGFFGLVSLSLSVLLDSILIANPGASQVLALSFNLCATFLFVFGVLGLFAALLLPPVRVWFSDLIPVISERVDDAAQSSTPHH